jgi:ABC-type multidrug transport system fused ATPase/permease subunit
MANFTTHIAVGTVASGLLSTMVMAANIVSPEQLLTLAAAGTLGSILPDVDLKDSRPSQAMFSLLAVFIAFAVLFNIGWRYSIAEMWILWALTYLGVRYIGGWIFHRLSYHRGIYHSLLAGAFFAFLTAAVYRHVLGANETLSWLGGIFMFAGYMVHLTLDEMYSVDVMDVRVKASFGTALKLYDTKHLGHSGAMAVATVLAFLVTPPFWASWKAVSQPEIRAGLQERLLPKQTWFGFIAKDFRMPPALRRATATDVPETGVAAKAALADEKSPVAIDASPITTGSISQPDVSAKPDLQSPTQTDAMAVPAPVR